MNFNRYVFDCYLATDSAHSTLAFFNQFTQLIKQQDVETIYAFVLNHFADADFASLQEEVDMAHHILVWPEVDCLGEEDTSIEEKIADYECFIGEYLTKGAVTKDLLSWLPSISFAHCIVAPEYFIPYFFVNRFYLLESIFRAFQIPLPPPPTRQQHRLRLSYYAEICQALYDFRCAHGLSPVELWAFLYDFALKTTPEFITPADTPEALNVYITGGNPADTERFYTVGPDFQSFWAGNEHTRPGDIILLYSLSPYSAITGIFRAFSKGYYDAFSYYPQRIWVGAPIRIPPVSLQELKANSVWGKKNLVKANMQGVNGRACSAEEYEALLHILAGKDFDVSVLPKRADLQFDHAMTFANEQDIEEHLLEPLLLRLGFSKQDWLRQMPLRMGRGERVYPDYALLPKLKRGEESAAFIWEAKYRIANAAHLREAFFQAKSYTLRLGSRGLGLVALEGVWLSLATDKFAFDKIQYYSWPQLSDVNIFTRMLKIAGKDAVA